ncbi:MAG TPA: glycine cleavage T C-terminal barrel domain-containing protein [Candidatus Eisenbacteria bacterium]
MDRIVEDYRSLREDGGAIDLAGWGVLRLQGPDARDFLQGTATQDLGRVEAPLAATTFFLTEKGRPVALAWVRPDSGEAAAHVIVDEGGRAALRAHFERFRIMEDVEFEGPEGTWRVIGVAGPRRAARLASLLADIPGSIEARAEPLSFLLAPLETAAERLPRFALPEAAEAWRLAVGLPRGGTDFGTDRLATELSLPEALSPGKGCYVGQEVVARTSNRGQVRRHRVGFRFPWPGEALPPGAELRAGGSIVGYVTSSAFEPGTGDGLGMGYLSTEALAGPAEVHAVHGSETIRLSVAGWPL